MRDRAKLPEASIYGPEFQAGVVAKPQSLNRPAPPEQRLYGREFHSKERQP